MYDRPFLSWGLHHRARQPRKPVMPRISTLHRRAILIGAFTALIPLSSPALAEDLIRVGFPDPSATAASVEEKKPLQQYLTEALGIPVKLIIPKDYNATIEGLGNGSLDFAYLGAVGYVKARKAFGVVPLVQRDIDKQFHSVFITQASSPINSIAD